MADLRKPEFWTNLIRKVLKQILQNAGIRTRKNSHNQHVVPHEEGWAVKGAGNERYSGVYDHQDDAIDRAKEIARNYKSTVLIHRKDGTIRDSISYRD